MQSCPVRLQQAIWTTFIAARPARRSIVRQFSISPEPRSRLCTALIRRQPAQWQLSQISRLRFYSDDKRSDLEKKIDDAQGRVNESIESRAENTVSERTQLKRDETIIHTIPESSSIVYNPWSPGETAAKATSTSTAATTSTDESPKGASSSSSTSEPSSLASSYDDLPSQLRARYSTLRKQFNHHMDNLQTHIFTASRRLNDLTGYTGIESLKRSIEQQEISVREARDNVRSSRDAYSEAIATRASTQREVNDLLHRKHAWSPNDLERFTSLYRSDHANEQSEQKAHERLTKAETDYEEASQRLSKSILARYHEEQVWSDKIRQMSTWGTWGLMGLNVLLFVVFQILIEPWRRRRLVTGFEQKVQEALRVNEAEKGELHLLRAEKAVGVPATAILAAQENTSSETTSRDAKLAALDMQDDLAAAPVEAEKEAAVVAASSEASLEKEVENRVHIEQAAEALAAAELLQVGQSQMQPASTAEGALQPTATETATTSAPLDTTTTEGIPEPTKALPPLSTTPYSDLPFLLGSHTRQYLDNVLVQFRSLFDERNVVLTTQRDLTAKMLEGAFFGAVGIVTLFWTFGVGRR